MARKRSTVSIISSAVMGQASIDSVLEYNGSVYPSLLTQFLATYGEFRTFKF